MKLFSASVAMCGALLVAGCHATEAKATADAPASTAAPPVVQTPQTKAGTVQLDADNLKQIKVDPAGAEDAPQALTTTGRVQFDENKMARILPPVSGQVQLLHVQVGDPVHGGEVLFMLNSRDVAAAFAEHIAAHRDLDLAQKTLSMTQDLYDHQAASKLSLQQAQNDVDKDVARLRQDEQVLRVLGVDMPEDADDGSLTPRVPVRAPLSGIVTQRSVTEGQFVDAQTEPLLTIADLSTVWVLADVFERNLRDISMGQKAEVTTNAYPDEKFVARVAQIGNVVDPETHTVTVRFLVNNPQLRLKPGMFASASIELSSTGGSSLTVPSTAVFMEEGKSYSYVQTGTGAFTRREVSTMPDGDKRVRVMAGLRQGDRVVTDGVLLLRQQETQEGK
jgi:cobalt-zinc-cadmium efflux system membrane fusion protein